MPAERQHCRVMYHGSRESCSSAHNALGGTSPAVVPKFWFGRLWPQNSLSLYTVGSADNHA